MHLRDFPTAAARPVVAGVCALVAVVGAALLGAASVDAHPRTQAAPSPTVSVVPIAAGDATTSAPPTVVVTPLPDPSAGTTLAPYDPAAVAAGDASAPPGAATTTVAPKRTVLLRGRGFGHGRGLGQWGAYGYAKDLGWSYRQILDHYYGGTVAGQVSPRSAIGVRLTALDGAALVVYQPKGRLFTAPEGQAGFTLPPGLAGAQSPVALGGTDPAIVVGPVVAAGAATTVAPVSTESAAPIEPPLLSAAPAAVKIQLVKGGFQISDGPTCQGPWSVRPGVVATPSVTLTAGPADPEAGPDDPSAMLQICSGAQRKVYRGDLLAVDGKPGQKTVNLVGLDAYLRGVVPREIAASWGDKAMEAVKAQAVAARSYAAAEKRNGYSNTCDTISCQVYGGRGTYSGTKFTSLEDPRTDKAIAMTANEVRVNVKTGAPMRTEFSASTGGFTAPGDYPPVPDEGDATALNPNHSWTVKLAASRFEASTKLGTLLDVRVTKRDGYGDGGGRATEVTFTYTKGTAKRSGIEVMSAYGLRSSWFDVALVADGVETSDTVVDAAAALTGDSGIVIAAAAVPKATSTKAPASAKSAKSAKKTRATAVTTTAVVVVVAGAAPVNTVQGGEASGAPTTSTPKRTVTSKRTSRTKAAKP